MVALKDHCNLLERCVSGPLTHTVYGNLNLTGTVKHTAYSVGCCHTQVIVAVGGEYGLSVGQSVHMLHQILYLGSELIGQAVTRGIGYVYYGSAGLDHSLCHAGQILVVRTSGILGIELNFTALGRSILYGRHGTLQYLVASAVELVTDVLITCTYAGVDTL